MQFILKFKKTVLYIAIVSFFTLVLQTVTAYASNLTFYNYSTNSYETYTGKQVIYTYNSREVALTYPGILIDGTALADYEDLFVSELGLKAERNGDVITIYDENTSLTFTVGSKNVLVNGSSDTISVAPVKLKFGDTVKYYMPTRYVAESFGFDYVWVSTLSTVRITKTFPLAFDENFVNYNGTLYAVNCNNDKISTDMPCIYYSGCVMVPGKQIFEAAGCTYTESEKAISIQKDELILKQEINSKLSYVNGKKIINMAMPVIVTDFSTGKMATYVSVEFVSDMLGFELSFDDVAKSYTLNEGELTGKTALYSDLPNRQAEEELTSDKITMAEEQPTQVYFEWTSSATNMDSEKNYLSKVRAYAVENADIIELYGITRDNIHDFFDNGLVVFELNNVDTHLDTQFFSDYSTPHLNYTLLTEINNNSRLFFYIPMEDEWRIVETTDGVRVYFSHADLSIEDLQISSVTPDDTKENTITLYPDDKIIIPLPETIEIAQVSDEDIYMENKFIIKISGNHENFYKSNPIINPYYGVNISEIKYDFVNNLTNIMFETIYLCGYKYSFGSGYLELNLGKPDEIYSNIVVLDAGHGGIDPGATKNGVNEKDINFKIVNTYLKDFFEKSDIKVYFTRESDEKIDLYERAAFSSKVGADMFISLHLNYNNKSSINGTEVYYSQDNNISTTSGFNSYQLAKSLVNTLSASLNSKNRGVLNSNFVVAKYNTVPAVLIELGYMSNKTEFSKLTDSAYQRKAAEIIYQTVTKLFDTYY